MARRNQLKRVLFSWFKTDVFPPSLQNINNCMNLMRGTIRAYRTKMNEQIFEADNVIGGFNLDTNAYADGVLDVKQRTDRPHLSFGFAFTRWLREISSEANAKVGFSTNTHEAMGAATLIGGTIVVPHLRTSIWILVGIRKCIRKDLNWRSVGVS